MKLEELSRNVLTAYSPASIRLGLRQEQALTITSSIAAASRVFGIAELLEQILLQVDDDTALLLSQRVNRHFKQCFQCSKVLQYKLFERSVPYDNSIVIPPRPKTTDDLRIKALSWLGFSYLEMERSGGGYENLTLDHFKRRSKEHVADSSWRHIVLREKGKLPTGWYVTYDDFDQQGWEARMEREDEAAALTLGEVMDFIDKERKKPRDGREELWRQSPKVCFYANLSRFDRSNIFEQWRTERGSK